MVGLVMCLQALVGSVLVSIGTDGILMLRCPPNRGNSSSPLRQINFVRRSSRNNVNLIGTVVAITFPLHHEKLNGDIHAKF